MRLRLIAASALAVALGAPLPEAKAAGTLTIAQAQDPNNWDPIITFLLSWGAVGSNIYDGLVMRDEQLNLKPGLATSWEVLDQGMRLRFKLREGVTFHNGEPFNAEAVKFTMERLLGPEGAKGPQQSNYTSIGAVEIIDPYSVDIVLKRPDPVMITKLAGYGAMIVPPKYVTEKGSQGFGAAPVGTGPFKVTGYENKVHITLEPSGHYWGGKPKLDKVIYKFIVEPATQVAELQSGRVDIASQVPIGMIGAITATANLQLLSTTGPTVTVARFNTANGATKDERVRKAIVMAVDREAIVKQILQGHAKPVTSFQSTLSFGFDPAQKPIPFDPAAARKLIAEAKLPPGTTVSVDFASNNTVFREVAQAIAGYLTAVGLKPQARPFEMNLFTNDIIPNGKTGEMFAMGWGGWTFDYDNTAYLMYHSGERWNPYDKDPALDAMLEGQRTIADRGERQKALQKIANYVAEHALELPLYNLDTYYGVNKRVKGLVVPPDNRFRLIDVSVD
ncbi:MAG: ABC transporter substrate-binding protein [Alphaproteobacteria bacterium]|nr:ABC transporter substrate-binding protein [Alphaproteobacteria bacterium]